ncbi:probable carboxylesterase 18 [Rosa rugosa]|uniref:probable carboxylesterase 18 n=1 Tax=Rosa rugosa TaxID=74645 RepID=UPI002B406D7D|nr:probable carboxylesterase 18 [Rosa rugosa]
MYRIVRYHTRKPKSLLLPLAWQVATKTTTSGSEPSPLASLSWKTRLALTLLPKVDKAARRPDGTVNRRLLNLVDPKASPKSRNGVTSSDVIVDPTRNLWFRLFIPVVDIDSTALPVVIYFHGGGFTTNSPSSIAYDAFCRRFAATIPAVVVSVNYRLSPEHRYPSQCDDGFDVVSFLGQNDAVLPKNADRSRIFLAGDSAGGNLAHHVAVRACRCRTVKLAGLVSIQPFFGGEERTESEIRLAKDPLVTVTLTDWLWKAFLPVGSTRDHEVANVSGPNAVDISGMEYPATVVFVGGADPLQDWQRRYYNWLRKSGIEAKLIEYPNMFHGFYAFPELPESDQLISRVTDFVASTSTSTC